MPLGPKVLEHKGKSIHHPSDLHQVIPSHNATESASRIPQQNILVSPALADASLSFWGNNVSFIVLNKYAKGECLTRTAIFGHDGREKSLQSIPSPTFPYKHAASARWWKRKTSDGRSNLHERVKVQANEAASRVCNRQESSM